MGAERSLESVRWVRLARVLAFDLWQTRRAPACLQGELDYIRSDPQGRRGK